MNIKVAQSRRKYSDNGLSTYLTMVNLALTVSIVYGKQGYW